MHTPTTDQTGMLVWLHTANRNQLYPTDTGALYGPALLNEMTMHELEQLEALDYLYWSNADETYVITQAGRAYVRLYLKGL